MKYKGKSYLLPIPKVAPSLTEKADTTTTTTINYYSAMLPRMCNESTEGKIY